MKKKVVVGLFRRKDSVSGDGFDLLDSMVIRFGDTCKVYNAQDFKLIQKFETEVDIP